MPDIFGRPSLSPTPPHHLEFPFDCISTLLSAQAWPLILGPIRWWLMHRLRWTTACSSELAAHAHEAAGRARHTRAQPLRARNRAWTALCLLRAGRWRKVAHAGLGALIGTGEAGGAGRRAGALGAVRALLAGDARLLALALLVRACRAPDARGHARVWRDRAGAALTRLRRAHTARRSWRALQAVVGARACLARQSGRRALRAVRAGCTWPAHQLARRGLEGAGLALETRAQARVGRDRAGAARRLLCATGWRVVALGSRRAFRISCEVGGVGVRARRARQRRAGALRAVRARVAGDARFDPAPELGVVLDAV
eukprot:scaffold16134_cov67-Phaeocystis_antarctica.AAC.2